MKKITSLFVCAVMMIGLFAGCSTKPEEEKPEVATEPINVAVLKGPTGMGMAKLMKDNEEKTSLNPYNFQISATADEIVSNLAKGTIDVAAVPANLASVLYNKTEGEITAAAINTLGVLYIVETGEEITSIKDLKGKTIYSMGKGTTPEYSLNYILEQNGIDPNKDVTIEYKSEASETASALLSSGEENKIALLPEPFVTSVKAKNGKIRTAVNLGEEWEKINGAKLVTGVIIVRNEFLENNKGAFDTFMSEYKTSTEFINTNIEEGAKIVGKYGIVPEAIAKQAIPNCSITFLEKQELETNLSAYLNILFEKDPKSIGGKLPIKDFYYLG